MVHVLYVAYGCEKLELYNALFLSRVGYLARRPGGLEGLSVYAYLNSQYSFD